MDCPVCKNAMVTLELQEVEIDYCTECEGIWLDAGELELLLDDPEKSKRLIESFVSDPACTERKRKCPICYRKMEKVVVGRDEPRLLIDRCMREHGLWFDKGELEEIVERTELDENNRIAGVLKDMFGCERQAESNDN